jgi:molybdopterin-binding protein
MRLSARNVLKGRITSIVRGATTAHVKVIKASDVMIGKD